MKATIARLLLLLLIVLLSAVPPVVATAAVKDISGGDLQPGVEYRFIFTSHGGNRVLSAAVRHKTCPATVAEGPGDVQALSDLPVKFFPAESGAKVVNVSANLYIQFSPRTELMRSLKSLCATRFSFWSVSNKNVTTGKQYVTAGGTPPAMRRFRIEAYGQDGTYKIAYCEDSCNDQCNAACEKDAGIVVEDGKGWLGLTDEATPFQFRKENQ